MRSVIFDLDLTLIDTTCLEEARHKRDWQTAYRLIPQTRMYDGIKEVHDVIRKHSIIMAIVSTAPRAYVERVAVCHNILVRHIDGYHDTQPIKPHLAQMQKALELMEAPAKDAISFGDRLIDIQASNATWIESVACIWGTREKQELLHSGYSHAIIRP